MGWCRNGVGRWTYSVAGVAGGWLTGGIPSGCIAVLSGRVLGHGDFCFCFLFFVFWANEWECSGFSTYIVTPRVPRARHSRRKAKLESMVERWVRLFCSAMNEVWY